MKITLGFLLLLVLALCACNDILGEDDNDEVVCTAQFVIVEFWVVDALDNPQGGFTLTVTNERTGETYDVEQYGHTDGLYSALHDSFKNKVEMTGDPVRVQGNDGTREFVADFVIGADRCHVHKISGPDSVLVP